MNLWKIERTDGGGGYDTYDMAVVAAETSKEARHTSPDDSEVWLDGAGWVLKKTMQKVSVYNMVWTAPDNVGATLVGKAVPGTERGVIVASFNAG